MTTSMKKFIHISLNPDGEITIDYSRGLDPADMLEALSVATRVVYRQIIEEEAQRRKITPSDAEKLFRLLAKQRKPEQN